MRSILLTGMLLIGMVLSACGNGNNNAAPATEEEVQETVQQFYNEMSKFDQLGKDALENFNTTLASYSAGQATGDELTEAVDHFQDTAADIADQVNGVKIAGNLPDEIEKLLRDSVIAFQSAYSIKEQASKSAVSPDVTAEEFDSLNQQADVAMLYGISKLNEARVNAGLIEAGSTDAAVLETEGTAGTDDAAETEIQPGTVAEIEAEAGNASE
ncbi:hypothetical protein [Paenibacillus tengchongensis]|uniref:hypothetical protein n=1 Tax=Paenibacillus tengchongensis TaxID=2608684 RepID=UPI00124D2E4A|nr:hypothetical protein [Paenibacillus tengchongensis]